MRAVVLTLVTVVGLALATGRADAYPQFQLSRDTTCTSCHIAPAGGGLLTENGLATADAMSQFGTNSAFMYGAIDTPDWLTLGGDARAMAGYMQTPQKYLVGFPMQLDLYANARKGNFSTQLTVGMRPAQEGNEALTRVWPREHYVMWQSDPGEREGQWIRAGHFMPVFGLRLVEHPAYTRRYGGTPLMGETYAASFSAVTEKYEGHVTGFINNPLMDAANPANGGAFYGEMRLGTHSQIGGGGMYTQRDWQDTYRGSLTAKHYLPTPGLLLQAELQYAYSGVSDHHTGSIIGYLMGSYMVGESVMIDLGLGHYDENYRVRAVDRDCIDLNVHWFATSHLELMLVSRVEVIGKTEGGPSSGWMMGQLHYRL
jgi:hypothetical protein